MITKLILDTEHARAGTPVALIDFTGYLGWGSTKKEMVAVQLPNGNIVEVEAAAVDGHEPEETLPALADALGIPYDTLVRYAREGRILARKSGGVWLSTMRAVEAAGIKPRK